MQRTQKVIGITLASFAIHFIFFEFYFGAIRGWVDGYIGYFGLSHIITYVISVVPLIVGAIIINRKVGVLSSLGLTQSVVQAAGYALMCTVPMFVGYAFYFDFNSNVNAHQVLRGVVCAGFFEELIFRAFLFGYLYRYAKLGFIPAIILGAVVFAIGHLHQSREVEVLIGVFIATFMGAIFFAWLYCEWRFNIWVPIFMHMFMNLSWMLFDVSNNAFGNEHGNLFRVITIALAIVLTIVHKKRTKQAMEVNWRRLFYKA